MEGNQEVDEVDVARRFSMSTGRGWKLFEKQPQGSDVDVVVRAEVGTTEENFQITVLYDPEFWRSVNTKGTTDVELTCDGVIRLIETAVSKKKNHYPLAQRQRVILLIDLVPGGMLAEWAREARGALASLLEEAAFNEVPFEGEGRHGMTTGATGLPARRITARPSRVEVAGRRSVQPQPLLLVALPTRGGIAAALVPDEQDAALPTLLAGTRKDHAPDPVAGLGAEDVPEVVSHDLGRNVPDVLAAILLDRLGEVLDEGAEEPEGAAQVSPLLIERLGNGGRAVRSTTHAGLAVLNFPTVTTAGVPGLGV